MTQLRIALSYCGDVLNPMSPNKYVCTKWARHTGNHRAVSLTGGIMEWGNNPPPPDATPPPPKRGNMTEPKPDYYEIYRVAHTRNYYHDRTGTTDTAHTAGLAAVVDAAHEYAQAATGCTCGAYGQGY